MRLLGTIAIPNGETKNNATTSAPFAMPENPCTLVYVPSATGLTFAHKASADVNDFALGTAKVVAPWGGRATGLVAAWNTTGGALTLKVFATDVLGPFTAIL